MARTKRKNTTTDNDFSNKKQCILGSVFTNMIIIKHVLKEVKMNMGKQKKLCVSYIGTEPFLRYSFTHYDAYAMMNVLLGEAILMPYICELYDHLLNTYPESKFEISIVKQFIVNYYENL
jgi:hypothetical protein